jgi:hypothetical protein
MQLKVQIDGPGFDTKPQTFVVNGFDVLDDISKAVARRVKAYLRTLAMRKVPHKSSVSIRAEWTERGGGSKSEE